MSTAVKESARRDAGGALDGFRETPIIPRWWFGERTSPRTTQVPRFWPFPDQAAAWRHRPGARGRWLFARSPAHRSLRRVPRAGLSGGADLAAGPPAPERRRAGGGGRSPKPPPVTAFPWRQALSPSTGPTSVLIPAAVTGFLRATSLAPATSARWTMPADTGAILPASLGRWWRGRRPCP
jgi:hypothetical protein